MAASLFCSGSRGVQVMIGEATREGGRRRDSSHRDSAFLNHFRAGLDVTICRSGLSRSGPQLGAIEKYILWRREGREGSVPGPTHAQDRMPEKVFGGFGVMYDLVVLAYVFQSAPNFSWKGGPAKLKQLHHPHCSLRTVIKQNSVLCGHEEVTRKDSSICRLV